MSKFGKNENVRDKMIVLRGQPVLLDRDVAVLYGVETKHINQAVRNNPKKFPQGYKFQLNAEELTNWRSKNLTSNLDAEERSRIVKGVRYVPTAFTGRCLYMLATILKSPYAVQASLAIVDTYAQVREMVRDMEALQGLKDGSSEQNARLSQAGYRLASLIGENLSTEATKTTIELNLAVLKITHEITRTKKQK